MHGLDTAIETGLLIDARSRHSDRDRTVERRTV